MADKLVVELGLLLLELHMSCRREPEQGRRMIMRQPARVDRKMVLLVLVHYTLELVPALHRLERALQERLAGLVQVLGVEGVYMSLLLRLGLLGTVSLPVEKCLNFSIHRFSPSFIYFRKTEHMLCMYKPGRFGFPSMST